MSHQLYRHFDADGKLLYVGISVSAVMRIRGHMRSPWFQSIAKITIENKRNKRQALKAERAAIQSERPLFNVKNLQPLVNRYKRIPIPKDVRSPRCRSSIPLTKEVADAVDWLKESGRYTTWFFRAASKESRRAFIENPSLAFCKSVEAMKAQDEREAAAFARKRELAKEAA